MKRFSDRSELLVREAHNAVYRLGKIRARFKRTRSLDDIRKAERILRRAEDRLRRRRKLKRRSDAARFGIKHTSGTHYPVN